MRKINVFIAALFLLSGYSYGQGSFTLSSKTLGGQATKVEEFNGFGCSGKNQSPDLAWENAPEGTQSFAITMYDPDAPTGSGWWHWLVFDLPASANGLPVNAGVAGSDLLPKGAIQSLTDYGAQGYGGPCPPEGHGLHQYIITVHALKTKSLGLDENANAAVVGYYIGMNTLAKASIVAYYERPAKK
ncbi:MAG: YbhB/YbcL family Raf kinase inhibitor-like protein [Bacteroidota bacterium]